MKENPNPQESIFEDMPKGPMVHEEHSDIGITLIQIGHPLLRVRWSKNMRFLLFDTTCNMTTVKRK